MASHEPQSSCGFSLYRGVLIQWDEDHDIRILRWIASLPSHICDVLMVAQEHEGSLGLVWHGDIPPAYKEGECVEYSFDDGNEEDYDSWNVCISRSIP